MSDLALLLRSLAVLGLTVLAAVALFGVWRGCTPAPRVVPSADVSERVEARPPLIRQPDAVTVARRVDSSAVEVETVRVQEAERYAATVTVETEHETIALGIRRVDPGWFHEFRLRRPDAVAVDLLPGYEAEVLTVSQRLPLLDVELAPQVGIGLSWEGVTGVAAVTVLRTGGVHLGGFAALGTRGIGAGPYASVKPRPGWSVGLGFDTLNQDPVFTLTLNL